jgi:hypothetical protein
MSNRNAGYLKEKYEICLRDGQLNKPVREFLQELGAFIEHNVKAGKLTGEYGAGEDGGWNDYTKVKPPMDSSIMYLIKGSGAGKVHEARHTHRFYPDGEHSLAYESVVYWKVKP